MLHILLLILKIIAVILAAILGILVLLAGTVLFMPLRYEVLADCDGTLAGLHAYVKCTWLFRIIRAAAVYQQKEFHWKLKILWFQYPSKKKAKFETMKEEVKTYEKKDEENQQTSQGRQETVEGAEKRDEKESELQEGIKKRRQKIAENLQKEQAGDAEKSRRFKKIYETIRQTYQKIKCTIQNLYDRIKALLVKKEKLSDFITAPLHQEALVKLKDEALHLLKRLKPSRIKGTVRYGFEDPCTTGQVLAGLSMLYPFLGAYTRITPDFEQQVLEGELHIKGKVRGIYFIIFIWKLFWCKAVRSTYKDIRNFEG